MKASEDNPSSEQLPESHEGSDPLFEQRLKKMEALREAGHSPYVADFPVDTTVVDFFKQYHSFDATALKEVKTMHVMAGRVMAINRFGKAAFMRLQDGSRLEIIGQFPHLTDECLQSGRLQIYLRQEILTEDLYNFSKKIDIGDFVGVHGTPMRTKTGELTLLVHQLSLLSKSLRPLPEKWHGLSDIESRYRQRYLDLMVNPNVAKVFKQRSALIRAVRQYFHNESFMEVETPMMQAIAGGATAKPFKTHHNALNCDFYLRIAPELFLKRLVVGGFEKVFEINRNFRNEGLSSFHNPEFTMLEFYETYANFEKLIKRCQYLLRYVSQEVLGRQILQYAGQEVSLEQPFRRLTMLEAIALYGGPDEASCLDEQASLKAVEKIGQDGKNLCVGERIGVLFEHYAESKLFEPTFITHFPVAISPLSRRMDADPRFVERYELFVFGRELANAFCELADPIEQKKRFLQQVQQAQDGASVDEDYVRALEYGLPPTVGFGIGIDRLAMFITGSHSIRDVILFPQLRPEH